MMIRHRLAWFGLLLLASSWHNAAPADTILTFDDLALPDFGEIPSTYGSRQAETPNVTVLYRTYDAATGDTIVSNLDFWNTGYGDLFKVGIPVQDGAGAEVTLRPDPGYAVSLVGFDLGGYEKKDQAVRYVRVVDANGNILWNSGDSTILGAGPSHSSFSPQVSAAGAIRIQWAANWDVGIDNIRFRQTLVPEPASLALLGVGLAGLGIAPAIRRQRRL